MLVQVIRISGGELLGRPGPLVGYCAVKEDKKERE
jgi:hypothetical protein